MRIHKTPQGLEVRDSATFLSLAFCGFGVLSLFLGSGLLRSTADLPLSPFVPMAYGGAFFMVGLLAWEQGRFEFDAAHRTAR